MVAHFVSGRKWPARAVLATALCGLLCAPAAIAFQAQNDIQIQTTGPERKIKVRIAPEYPELAKRTKITGVARVEMLVMADGSVKTVKEVGGNPVLLNALVSAVKKWRYEPASKESVMEVKANFF